MDLSFILKGSFTPRWSLGKEWFGFILLNYVDLQTVNIFQYTISKQSHLLIWPPIFIRKVCSGQQGFDSPMGSRKQEKSSAGKLSSSHGHA